MTHFEQEILDIHVALENWLGAGEGDWHALLARFSSGFSDGSTEWQPVRSSRACPIFICAAGNPTGAQDRY